MNSVKKILVNMKNPRGVYSPHNIRFKRKMNPSLVKEELRQERKFKKINRFDDEITKEKPIDSISNNKAAIMYKMLNEFVNVHRLNRKEMPKEEKMEYIKKCKEFSLFKANQWRHKRLEMLKCRINEQEMMKAACLLLPTHLMGEVLDIENVLDEYENRDDPNHPEILKVGKHKTANQITRQDIKEEEKRMKGVNYMEYVKDVFKENSPKIEYLEYSREFLYFSQLLRIYPDDFHIIYKTMMNLSSYKDVKVTGSEGSTENAYEADDNKE